MTALDHSTHGIDAPLRTVTVVERVANGARALLRALLNRRELTRLGDLTDYELADIGLKRADIELAMRSPLAVDPTAQLSALAHERRRVENGARHVC